MHKSHKKKKHHRRSKSNSISTDSDISSSIQNLQLGDSDHQQSKNITYEIANSNIMGRYILAAKRLEPGEIILSELPIVVGPLSSSGVSCLECYSPINAEQLKNCKRCTHCGWLLCNTNCINPNKPFDHTENECKSFKSKEIDKKINFKDYNSFSNEFCAIVPFRCLLLKNSNPTAWNKILNMESHNILRQQLPELWNANQTYIVDRIRKKWGFLEYTEEDIHTVCGILEVNAFEIGHHEIQLRALYPSAFLLAHDCVPNTTHIDDEVSLQITIRATILIGKGQPITLSYAHTLQSTLKRRESLLENKFFLCQCNRCTDPTELGTYLSALKCPKCHTGLVLSTNPLDHNALWRCNNEKRRKIGKENRLQNAIKNSNSNTITEKTCSGYVVTAESMNMLMQRIGAEVDKINGNDVVGYEAFLKRYCNVLHPSQYHCLTVKHSLSQLYGKITGYMIHELTNDLLQRKIEICRDVLRVFNILEPGYSRLRGITLYELHAPLMILAARDFENKTITKSELRYRLKEIVKCLEESFKILSFEPKSSSEGLMAEAAFDALNKILNWQKFIGKI